MGLIPLRQYVKYTDFAEAHHLAFWNALQDRLTPEQAAALSPGGELNDLWLAAPRPAAQAQAKTHANPLTWVDIRRMAEQAGARYPELVCAQWQQESGGGKHEAAKNNPFGLKGPGTKAWTTEHHQGQVVSERHSFLEFESYQAAVTYLVDRWHKNFRHFKGVNNAPSRNEAARELQRQGYATDPGYSAALIRIMNEREPIKAAPLPPRPQLEQLMVPGVPRYKQMDSATDQARRMCFSSSCAMLLKALVPNAIHGVNGDDQYLARVMRFGDTTEPAAHVKALGSYGLKARFIKNGNFELIDQQLRRGHPVPCGYLHRGHVSKPSGGGHWLCVIGSTPTHVIVNDPLNEADLVSGATLNKSGMGVHYSKKNFGRRWMVEGPGNGWAMVVD